MRESAMMILGNIEEYRRFENSPDFAQKKLERVVM